MQISFQDGRDGGDMEQDAIEAAIASGELSGDDWVWDDNTSNWAPLRDIFPQFFPSFPEGLQQEVQSDGPEGGAKTQESDGVVADDPVALFCADGQNVKFVRSIMESLNNVLEADESVLYIATQRKPFPDLTPEALALTSFRIMIYEKGHFKTLYDEFPLTSLLQPRHRSGWFFGHISFNAGAGELYGVRFIPKLQARKFFSLLEQQIHQLRARQPGGFAKAAAKTVSPIIQGTAKPASSIHPVIQPTGRVAAAAKPISPQVSDIGQRGVAQLHRLETLKKMLDDELLTEEDYAAKKQAILEEL